MAKRKLTGRKRKLNRAEVFPQREKQEMAFLMFKLREAFPDPDKRLQYIKDLIHGLETEPIVEN
jgi:hypothetical protein